MSGRGLRYERCSLAPLMRASLWVSLLVAGALAAGATVHAVPPTGFEDSLVAAIPSPTGLAFTPDGRLLVTTQAGALRVISDKGVLQQASALNLSSSICTNSERGLLGVAVDPAFSTNRSIYLYYTFNKSGVCEKNTSRSPVNRVSRFVLSDIDVDRSSVRARPDRQHSLAERQPQRRRPALRQGRLSSTSASATAAATTPATAAAPATNDASRDQQRAARQDAAHHPDGGIPSDNPFRRRRHRVAATSMAGPRPGQNCQETYAWGLRNPFRFAFDPNAAGTRFFINDVGQDTWEEIDQGQAGADYGWNMREGHCARPARPPTAARPRPA